MKKLFTPFLFICFTLSGISQSKLEFGITTEGAWFIPGTTFEYSPASKNGFGAGIGTYASKSIYGRLSADIGLAYRYKEMEQQYTYNLHMDGNSEYNAIEWISGWKKYSLHNIVIPVHLQMLLGKYFFLRGGIEEDFLINFDKGSNKPDYSWTTGFGSQKHRLKWSLNYIRGFKDEGFLNGVYEWHDTQNTYKSGTSFRNNMLQLNLSYPIWHLK